MGAFISKRKRCDEGFRSDHSRNSNSSPPVDLNHRSLKRNSSSSPPVDLNRRSLKRIRFSSLLDLDYRKRDFSFKSSVNRIHRYPQRSSLSLRREIHAPCRVFKSQFRNGDRGGQTFGRGAMGNVFGGFFGSTRKSTDKYYKSDTKGRGFIEIVPEVINLDREVVDVEVSDDSCVEEIVVIKDGKELQSLELDRRYPETSGVVSNVLDPKSGELIFQPSCSDVVLDEVVEVDDSEKITDLLTRCDGEYPDYTPVYKKLYEVAHGRDSRLERLNSLIDLEEQRLSSLRLSFPAKKSDAGKVVRPDEAFVQLTPEEEAEVFQAFSADRRNQVLVAHEKSGIEITGKMLLCLRPGGWLNDEVINLFLELLKEREKREPKKFLKCHFFNTFFYKKLYNGRNGYDFKAVKRWTTHRKLGYGLIECDKVIVPIHKETHWCLAVINKKDEKFQYLDSLGGKDARVLKVLAKYYVDELKDKSGEDIDVSSWKHDYVEDLPEQKNTFDCGMFMIKYTDFYSRGAHLCFNQEHMEYFRLRTALEILRLRAE